jgi:hypothetical protein
VKRPGVHAPADAIVEHTAVLFALRALQQKINQLTQERQEANSVAAAKLNALRESLEAQHALEVQRLRAESERHKEAMQHELDRVKRNVTAALRERDGAHKSACWGALNGLRVQISAWRRSAAACLKRRSQPCARA